VGGQKIGLAIQVIDVVKRYPLGAGGFTAIDRLSFDIAQGDSSRSSGDRAAARRRC